MVKFTIITLFEEAIKPYLDSSMMWKAQEMGALKLDFVSLRDFGLGPHQSVDDTPYGGGDGMLLRCEPAFAAIESVKAKDPTAEVIIPTPVGDLWTQELARRFAGVEAPEYTREALEASIQAKGSEGPQNAPERHFVIFCPRYEGYDERILSIVDHKICLGPYVLTGGELPALIIIDSVIRLIPGVLGGNTSASIESFSEVDNLEYPQYTKPADFRGMKVPEILLSGDHGKIAAWRKEQSKKAEWRKNSI